MPRLGSRQCLHCQAFFTPHPRSKGRQKYCSASSCRQASKSASQNKWLKKEANLTYFQGAENVQRVRQWRLKNPGYWKAGRQLKDNGPPLQETIITQVTDKQKKISDLVVHPLQELIMAQPFVLIGLIAQLTDSALQDDIVETGRRLRQLGEDFLYHSSLPRGASHDRIPVT